jgi:FtsP/CotA-like multicopper oxidase with cupredoxin domain
LEFDQINSFHVHANFFDEYKTGTRQSPDFFTDTIIMGQGERSILDLRFRFAGKVMFHAHKTEFAEKGWMGFFEVVE